MGLKKSLIFFVILLCSFSALAKEEFHADITDIGYVGAFLKGILSAGIKTDEVLVLYDVDGTITNCSSPSKNKNDYPARANAIQLLKWTVEQNIPIVVSSAARNFRNTLKKLQFLGVADILKIPLTKELIPRAVKMENLITVLNPVSNVQDKFIFYKSGLVISAREFSSEEAFIKKALAVRVALSDAQMAKIKHVIMIDDRADYARSFSEDIKKYFPLLFAQFSRIDYWILTSVNQCGK